MSDDDESWHLDKRVPISLLAAIVAQTMAFAWWGATQAERVTVLKERMDAIAPNSDRLTRVEVKVDGIQQSVARIEGLVRSQK
jgi:acyl-CoA reductase-like NAD-dependent aldehyde dehydrogenase